MLFLMCFGMGWAQPQGFPQLSTQNSPKWYLIKNVRSGKYASWTADNSKMLQISPITEKAFFWFEAGGYL